MAGAFYNRYIPSPNSTKQSHPEYTHSSKRRRVEETSPAEATPEDNPSQDLSNVSKQEKKEKKRKGRKTQGSPKEEPSQDGGLLITTKGALRAAEATAEESQPQEIPKSGKEKKRKKITKPQDASEMEVDQDVNLLSTAKDPDSSLGGAALEDKRHKKLRLKLEKTARANAKAQASKALEDNQVLRKDGETDASLQAPTVTKVHGLEPLPQLGQAEAARPSTLEALPEWIRKPTRISSRSTGPLSELLPEHMSGALSQHGYTEATAIQSGLLPVLMPSPNSYEGDICIASSTGTGKTLAFIAPMVEALSGRPTTYLRGLVIVPTREMVAQTLALTEICAAKSGLQIGTAKGSKEIGDERRLIVRKTARYDKRKWDKVYGAPFDPIGYVTSDDDASDSEFNFMQAFDGFVPDHKSKVDILICTPGRLVEHIRSTKGFTLDHVEWLIVDEMDRLLDQSFQDWTETVIPALEYDPKALSAQDTVEAGLAHIIRQRRVRKILASATVTLEPDKIAVMKLWRPRLVVLDTDEATTSENAIFQIPEALQEVATRINDAADKPLVLVQILKGIFLDPAPDTTRHISKRKPSLSESTSSSGSDSESSLEDSTSSSGSSDESDSDSTSSASTDTSSSLASPKAKTQEPSVLIFTAKNENAMRLGRLLSLLDPSLSVGTFTASSKHSTRRKILAGFRSGHIRVLIASNLASRSLNLAGLDHVINYDVPTSAEMYIHRVGRTARAGKSGIATTLLARHEARWFWNEIARAPAIQRRRKVSRGHAPVISDEYRARYEDALARLGEEAKAH